MGKAAAKRGVDIGIDSTVLQANYGNAATIDFRFAATVMAAVGAKETPANATAATPMAHGRSRYETGKELGAGGMGVSNQLQRALQANSQPHYLMPFSPNPIVNSSPCSA